MILVLMIINISNIREYPADKYKHTAIINGKPNL